MMYQRNTVLAGVAALALVAGTGFASAQDQSKQGKEPHGSQSMKGGTGAPTGKTQQSTEQKGPGPNAAQAHEKSPGSKAEKATATEKTLVEQRKNGAMTGSQPNKTGAAAPQGKLQGLQSNASGTNAKLSDEQRTRIRQTVINAGGAPRVGQVNFAVAVGTVIPRDSIQIVPVPETLVEIDPAWRGFLYFVYEDEIVIVNPRNMRIVAVLVV